MNPTMYLRNRFLGNRWANSLVIISSISTLSLALADDRGVRIHHAIEVEFETERGRVHHVQGHG